MGDPLWGDKHAAQPKPRLQVRDGFAAYAIDHQGHIYIGAL